jgi:hypothetical protein
VNGLPFAEMSKSEMREKTARTQAFFFVFFFANSSEICRSASSQS